MSRDGQAALPRGATGLSVVCDCDISRSYSLTIFDGSNPYLKFERNLIKMTKLE